MAHIVTVNIGHVRNSKVLLLLLLLLPPGAEIPLVESFDLLNDLFPFPLILDAGYPVWDLPLEKCPV
jgi:hypothetical protein